MPTHERSRPEDDFEPLTDDPGLQQFNRLIPRPAQQPTSDLLEFPRDVDLDEMIARQSTALIKGQIHPGELGMVYGESAAGKTFVVTDAAWHIALGRPWHGRKVNQAPVLYACLEGVTGFRKRMEAATRTHGDPGSFFARLKIPVSLVRDDDGKKGAQKIIEAARELAGVTGQSVGLIVIDTLARAMAGDNENDTKDMTAFVEHRAAYLARETGAAVLVVHHTNAMGDDRGSKAFRAACDFIWKCWKRSSEKGGIERGLIADKIKDGEEGPIFDYQLETIHLAEDDDGDALTSCVVRSSAPKPQQPKEEPAAQRRFRAAFTSAREKQPAGDVPLPAVRDAFIAALIVDQPDPKKAAAIKRKAWQRALENPPGNLEIVKRGDAEYVRVKGTTSPEEDFEPIENEVL